MQGAAQGAVEAAVGAVRLLPTVSQLFPAHWAQNLLQNRIPAPKATKSTILKPFKTKMESVKSEKNHQ